VRLSGIKRRQITKGHNPSFLVRVERRPRNGVVFGTETNASLPAAVTVGTLSSEYHGMTTYSFLDYFMIARRDKFVKHDRNFSTLRLVDNIAY
jgi:hypothetical protein